MNTITIRNTTLGDGRPKICIPVTAGTQAELWEQAEKIAEVPCQMVEWRMDFFHETRDPNWIWSCLEALRKMLGDRLILATFRTKEEGGERSISMEEYQELNLQAAKSGLADLIDIELNRGEELVRDLTAKIQALGVKVIGSYHDFEKTPDQETLINILCKMQELGVDMTKAAVMPQNEKDVLAVLGASVAMKTQYADRPFLTMSMGPLGGISRLCGAVTGSAVTFATEGRASAPGQMDAKMVAQVLNALQI